MQAGCTLTIIACFANARAAKPFFSAAWYAVLRGTPVECCDINKLLRMTGRSRTGRKGPYAHYYVQVSPKDAFVGK
jgi:hypothetical protein